MMLFKRCVHALWENVKFSGLCADLQLVVDVSPES